MIEKPCPWPITELVPHSGRMCLLDEAVSYSADSLTARVSVNQQSVFLHTNKVPAWVGIEYMAQAIAAWAGTQQKQRGGSAQIGFLLGSRKFISSCDSFPVGAELVIHVERVLQDDSGLGSFDCHLSFDQHHQQARLNVFQPPNVDAYMQSLTGKTHV